MALVLILRRAIYLMIPIMVATAVLADAEWLFRRALPAIPRPHYGSALSRFHNEEVEDQNALMREERGHDVDTAIAAGMGALSFGGLAFALLYVARRIREDQGG